MQSLQCYVQSALCATCCHRWDLFYYVQSYSCRSYHSMCAVTLSVPAYFEMRKNAVIQVMVRSYRIMCVVLVWPTQYIYGYSCAPGSTLRGVTWKGRLIYGMHAWTLLNKGGPVACLHTLNSVCSCFRPSKSIVCQIPLEQTQLLSNEVWDNVITRSPTEWCVPFS